jgi:hypothetical protein
MSPLKRGICGRVRVGLYESRPRFCAHYAKTPCFAWMTVHPVCAILAKLLRRIGPNRRRSRARTHSILKSDCGDLAWGGRGEK